jgi:hypothetical protein
MDQRLRRLDSRRTVWLLLWTLLLISCVRIEAAQALSIVVTPADVLHPGDISITAEDNLKADVSVAPTVVNVTEGGVTANYQVVLTSQPTDAVIINITPDGQTTVNRTVLVFHAGNWDKPQIVIVAAVNDRVVEGPHTRIISHTVTSNDPEYSLIDPDDVLANIQDNDTASIFVSPTSLTVAEPDSSAPFTITLTSRPTFSVTVPLSSSNDECAVSESSATLSEQNWETGVRVSAMAQDDAVDDDDQLCKIMTAPALSNDPIYNGWDAADVSVTVQDDDEAGITITPLNLTISEPDGSAVFTVTLTSEPTAPVTIPLAPSNNQCRIASPSVLLHSGNWHSSVRTTVIAIDDDILDGDRTCIIQAGPGSSSDPHYQGLSSSGATVLVQDDDRERRIYLPLAVRDWPPTPATPTLQPISNPDNDGAFTVTWTTVPDVTAYRLEQALDSAFTTPTTAYQGTATSFNATNYGPTRYFFRVQARTAYGDGPWSNAQSVDVLWEREPNDQIPNDANGPLVSGLTYFGAFPVPGDINDYFYIDLSGSGTVEVTLRSIAVGQNYDLVLRNADRTSVGYSGNLDNADESLRVNALPAGRYYIQVYHRSPGSSPQTYQLTCLY